MTEEQGNEIIDLLSKIHSELRDIKSNTSSLNSAYNMSDVCSRLDDVVGAIENNSNQS